MLQLDQVTKVYPTVPPVQALRGVSLTVQRGELVGIVGPSGSGKTTLLHLMGTLDRPSSGTVRLTGLDVATMADADLAALRATRIGFVFQQFFLAEHQTILDNVADGLLYAGVRQAERRERACEALDLVDLGSRLWSRPTQLSGGQRQRVAIARALVGDPAIVLADEPTGNLDQTTGQAILSLLAHLHERGVTILVITHDRAIAERMPRRVEMLDGRIVYDTPTATSHRPAMLDAGRPERSSRPDPPWAQVMTATPVITRRKLPPADLGRLASVGLRTRKLRAGMSALGIAIGVAAIVAVLGLSSSSQAGLLAEIDQLGTNMLTVQNGQTLFGQPAELPKTAPAMIGRIAGVTAVQDTAYVPNIDVFRSQLIPSIDTNALSVQAASLGLLHATGDTLAQGSFLNAATATQPVAVLGPWPRNGSGSTASSPASASGSVANGSTWPESSTRPSSPPTSTPPFSSAIQRPRPTSAPTVIPPPSTCGPRPTASTPSRHSLHPRQTQKLRVRST